MIITEMLQFADSMIFEQTGQHLDDLQKTVIQGVWEGKTYEQIGEEANRSESRVRDIGYKLLQLLSESLGEDIKKKNFRSTIERLHNKSHQIINIASNHNFNFCYQSSNPNNKYSEQNSNNSLYKDLTLAPKINQFYGREKELLTLSQWLENPNTQLISILGLRGIGKTTLIKYFIDTHSLNFESIIWKNIKLSPQFDTNILNLLDIFPTDKSNFLAYPKSQLNQCFELFQQKRFLIILDDVQELFITGQFAGKYKPEYQNYKTFFQMFTSLKHQSCLILISQEKCTEMISLDQELYDSYCLELEGLGDFAKSILESQSLNNLGNCKSLIELYQGNPQYLKSISLLIKDIFQGNVYEFMQENELIIPEDLHTLFYQTWLRLAKIEQDILLLLSTQSQSLTREEIKHKLCLSSTDTYGSLQSLIRRFLLIEDHQEPLKYTISTVLKEMVIYLNR